MDLPDWRIGGIGASGSDARVRVLVIVRDDALRQQIAEALGSAYDLDQAPNVEEALRRFEAGARYAVALVEARGSQPEDLSDLRSLRMHGAGARTILVAREMTLDRAVAALAAGAAHVLSQPLTPGELRAVVAASDAAAAAVPPISVRGDALVTSTGFTVHGHRLPISVERHGTVIHRFEVSHPVAGSTREVEVRLDPGVFVPTAHPQVAPASELGRQVARRVLAEYLWREGMTPPAEGISVHRLDPKVLEAALGDV